MQKFIVGFGFLAFFSFILGAGIVMGAIAAVELEKIGIDDMVWLTPLAFSLFVINALIVYGLKQNKKWALVLAAVEMTGFIVMGVIGQWTNGLSFIAIFIYMIIPVAVLMSLKREFDNPAITAQQ